MARNEARLAVSIWSDRDFLALSPSAQRHFMFLISQPDLAHDGVLALRERRWSKSADGLTVEQIRTDHAELSGARFIVLDEDTEELLVRSFIRRDGVYRQPNVLRSAASHLATVASPAIRSAVAIELERIQAAAEDIPEGSKGVLSGLLETLGGTQPEPLPEPSGEPFAEGLHTTSAKSDGERGVVTAVSSGSPSPFPLSTSPVPRPQPPAAAPREDARKRGTRIPDDFATTGITPEMVIWARENTPGVNGGYETAKFVDYWRAKTGRDATKLDWPGTWRNWMRKASERAGPTHGRPTTDDRVNDILAAGRRLQAIADQQHTDQPELTA